MIKTGDICPLFFSPLKNRHQQDIDYIQRFYANDRIVLQFFSNDSSDSAPQIILHDLVSGSQREIQTTEYDVNDSVRMFYCTISGLSDSVYMVEVKISDGNMDSEPFCICSDSLILNETCLISCSHRDNNSLFDNIFWIDDEQVFFDFRLEGGFRPDGYSAKVENEQFRNQRQEIVELYSVPYDTYSLTLGSASGVPCWFMKYVNRALCVSEFIVNGISYVRSGNSVPEISAISEDGQMFVGTVLIEPKQSDIAGIGGAPGGDSAINMVGFNINNPKKGEMLQYDDSEMAFVNTDKIEV